MNSTGRTAFVVRWTLGTVIGAVLALITIFGCFALIEWTVLFGLKDFTLGIYAFYLLVILVIVAGGVLGYIQWIFGSRKKVNVWAWISVNLVAAIPFILSIYSSYYLFSPSYYPYLDFSRDWRISLSLGGTWFLTQVGSSILSGLAIGLPQWIALRYYFNRAVWWPVITIIAFFAASTSVLLFSVIINDAFVLVCLDYLAIPLIYGLITGLFLFTLLKRPKRGLPLMPDQHQNDISIRENSATG